MRSVECSDGATGRLSQLAIARNWPQVESRKSRAYTIRIHARLLQNYMLIRYPFPLSRYLIMLNDAFFIAGNNVEITQINSCRYTKIYDLYGEKKGYRNNVSREANTVMRVQNFTVVQSARVSVRVRTCCD